MNRYEEELWMKDAWNSLFFSCKVPIYTERTKKRRKKEYQQLIISLKLFKDLKEKETYSDKKTYSYVEPIYTDEDKEFLKHAVNNGELTIRDLTFEEAMLLGFSGKDYRRAARQAYSKVVFTNVKKRNEFDEKLSKMISPTPRIITTVYNQIQKKK